MNLTPNFTVDEFTATQHRNIDNSLPATLLPAATRTCEMLERIRALLGQLAGRPVPLIVTSGYRCLALNRAIGSSDTSDHIMACAADFRAPAFGRPFEVATVIAQHREQLQVGQVIHEFGRWIHVSTREPARPINQVITISSRGTVPGIVEV